ncbi:hypothetical protein [Lyngbya sp. CCY1209]|uniref:hypothetical protein n=1 Tax=Lyngbya sp. CCY1209 TaxID=2886103 RepID=UPI002D20C83A|nr:hypothetical protein [Lyngbya sp. CCY1209]MEB3883033.1 hypothetical protein [Lyngbya sp. CCY1209]
MSEAGLPPNQSPSEPIPERRAEPSEETPDIARPREAVRLPQVSDPWDDDWETVNFPNAIAIDQLPVVTDSDDGSSPTPEPDPRTAGEATEATADNSQTPLIQALHTCNRDLIDRIAELEEELEGCHRRLQEQDAQIDRQGREMGFAREQVTRLFRKLEVANRVIEQQQVLVENLTHQWDTSQTRMAQMERECAAAQQRYNEQCHELIRTQNTCQELRSRLYRQQRHTLQFKAALERALEMQSHSPYGDSQRTTSPSPTAEAEGSATPAEPQPPASFVLHPPTLKLSKASPVQPWSWQLSHHPDEGSEEGARSEETPGEENQTSSGREKIVDSESPPAATAATAEEGESGAIAPPVAETFPEEPPVEEWPRPRFVEEELDRIRLEYAASPPETEDAVGGGVDSEGEREEREANWPAPLIYPQRRRKLQSLSAIQLPRFSTSAVEEKIEF